MNSTSIQKTKSNCEICHDTGWKYLEEQKAVVRCACKTQAIIEEKLSVILADWKQYKLASLEDYKAKPNTNQAEAYATVNTEPAGNYFFVGRYNRGKTYLLVAQYRYLVLHGIKCVIRTADELMKELIQAEKPVDRPEQVIASPVLQLVNKADIGHLFIDDIDKLPTRTGYREETLFSLFDTIKRREIGLSISSNVHIYLKDEIKKKDNLKDLRDALGNPITSRIYNICRTVNL